MPSVSNPVTSITCSGLTASDAREYFSIQSLVLDQSAKQTSVGLIKDTDIIEDLIFFKGVDGTHKGVWVTYLGIIRAPLFPIFTTYSEISS
jgi:hypothetical protein